MACSEVRCWIASAHPLDQERIQALQSRAMPLGCGDAGEAGQSRQVGPSVWDESPSRSRSRRDELAARRQMDGK